MRLVDLVGSAAPIVGVFVGALMAVGRRVVRHYESRAAFGPESAVAASGVAPAAHRLVEAALARGAGARSAAGRTRMAGRGASGTRYRRARRRRALAVVLLLVVSLLLAAWFAATRR